MKEDYRNYQQAAHFLWELLDRIAQEGDVTLAERRHDQALVVNGVLRWRWEDGDAQAPGGDELLLEAGAGNLGELMLELELEQARASRSPVTLSFGAAPEVTKLENGTSGLRAKAAGLRQIAACLQKGDGLDETFECHYGGQAAALEDKADRLELAQQAELSIETRLGDDELPPGLVRLDSGFLLSLETRIGNAGAYQEIETQLSASPAPSFRPRHPTEDCGYSGPGADEP